MSKWKHNSSSESAVSADDSKNSDKKAPASTGKSSGKGHASPKPAHRHEDGAASADKEVTRLGEERGVAEKSEPPVIAESDQGRESGDGERHDSDAGAAYYDGDAGGGDELSWSVEFPYDAADAGDQEVTEMFLRQLPKAELHCHLDGSVRVETILELAEQQKVRLPANDVEALRKKLVVGEDCRSLEDYLKAFETTLSIMQDAESLERIAYELVADAADENIRYLEVRYSPILHTRRGMRLTHIVDAVNDGLKRGEREFGVTTGVIICGMRNINPEISYQLAELAVAYKNRGVVAFDLAGAETDHPAKKHREAFFLILRNNINCTLHAGESYGPESIHQALHYCGAHRIGHGTRLKEDGDLLNYVNDHRIPLEICLTSNVQTRATRSFGDHPLRFYYDYGLRTTINTDNRLMSDTTVSKELFRAHLHLGFEMDELVDLIIFGFKSAFLPYRAKVKMLRKVYEELRAMNLTARTQRMHVTDDHLEPL